MIVAILTPRADAYNHRWIVAEKHGANHEILLSQWLEALKSDDNENPDKAHGILFRNDITQTNGRQAEEFVFLYDEDFGELDSGKREELSKELSKLHIDEIVRQTSEMPCNQDSLIYPNNIVSKFQKDLNDMDLVPASHKGFPKTKVKKSEEEQKKAESKKKSFRKRVGCALVLLALLGCGIWAWMGLFSKDPKPSEQNTPSESSISEDESSKEDSLNKEERKEWDAIRAEWGDEEISIELVEEIYEKLIGKTDWKDCKPPQTINSVRVLSSSEIRPEDADSWNCLQGVNPVKFRSCVKKFITYHSKNETPIEWWDGSIKIWDDSEYRLNSFVNRSEYSDAEIMKKMEEEWNEKVLELAKEHIFEPKVESKIGSDYQDDVRAKFNTDTQNASDAIAELGRFVRFSNGEPELVDYFVKDEKVKFYPPTATAPLSRREVIDYLAKLPGEVCPEWIVEFSKLLDDKRTP